MNQGRLASLIKQPEIQRKILNDYEGGYSIGVTLNPKKRSEIAIRIHIQDKKSVHIPSQITLDGETIPIIVNTNFKLPEPLSCY